MEGGDGLEGRVRGIGGAAPTTGEVHHVCMLYMTA